MYTVRINSKNEGADFQTFNKEFINLCSQHKQEGKALAFAFILYDFTNPYIAKVIEDKNYWLSLNAVSGKYLTVFSFHYKQKVRFKRNFSNQGGEGPYTQYMTDVNSFNEPSQESNAIIQKYFGNGINVNYPAILFFQIHDDKVIDYTMIELKENQIESSFLELQDYIKAAVESLKIINEENTGNSKEIFTLVSLRVNDMKTRQTAKKVSKTLTSVTGLVSSIMGLEA